MKTRIVPLTLCWYLLLWRGGSRFAAGPIHIHSDGRIRTIGATVSICRLTIGLARLGTSSASGIRRPWFRDFGQRLGRYSIGGWRTAQPVPLSTSWITDGGPWPRGFTVTIASRTLCFVRLHTAREYRGRKETLAAGTEK